MSLDAMKQALAALNDYEPNEAHKVATALRAAIEQAQEPVVLNGGRLTQYPDGSIGVGTPAKPDQWQGLTDEEIEQMMDYWSEDARSAYGGAHRANGEYVYIPDIIRDAEKRLKEKNT